MPETATGTFPPIKARPKMPWTEDLSVQAQRDYTARRLSDIEDDRADIIALIQSMPEFDGVSPEAIYNLADYAAVLATDSYDIGIQVGGRE